MTAPVAGQSTPQLPKAENSPAPPRQEDSHLFQRALERNRLPMNKAKRDNHFQPEEQTPSPMSPIGDMPLIRPTPPHPSRNDERSGGPTAPPLAPNSPLTHMAANGTSPAATPAPDLTQALVQLDSSLPPSARSDLQMPGDQWIVRNVAIEQDQAGLSLGMEMRQDDQDEDALDDLIRRLRARGIAAKLTVRDAEAETE